MKDIVKIFSVTRNEADLIEDFVQYHGSIFGFSNIVLIDNNSDCPVVLGLYERFRRMGVVVEEHMRGQPMAKYMTKYKHQCTFMVELDTYEFIQFSDFLSMKPDKTSVPLLTSRFRAFFSSLPEDCSEFDVVTYFNAVPDPSIEVRHPAKDIVTFCQAPAKATKCFSRSGNEGRKIVVNELCCVHFHDIGPRRNAERARNTVSMYGYVDVDTGLTFQLQQLLSKVTTPHDAVFEYAVFLTKVLTLQEIVRNGAWPPNPSALHEMAMCFPPVFGFGSVCTASLLPLPSDWSDRFDGMILYDKPLSACRSSSVIRTIVSAGTLLHKHDENSGSRPKVALMISGHLRNFASREAFWSKFVADFQDVDIYVHTWSDSGERGPTEWIDVGKNKQSHARAKSILNPVEMVVENHEDLYDEFSFHQPDVDLYYGENCQIRTTDDFSKCIGSQLYSIKSCFELTQRSGRTYDVYVRLRGDSVVHNFSNLMCSNLAHISDNALVINGSDNHVHLGGGRGCMKCDVEYCSGVRDHGDHSNDVCDIFYFGKHDAMAKVCSMYDNVKALVRGFQEHNTRFAATSEVQQYLSKFGNVTVVTSPHIYEKSIKCFYPERLIREFMKDFWLISDTLGLVPNVQY